MSTKLYGYLTNDNNLNDVALNDDWAVPSLALGIYSMGRTLPYLPYLKDIWYGRDLLFGNKNKKDAKVFYKSYIHPKTTFNKEIGEISYPNSAIGKIDKEYLNQIPALRFILRNARNNIHLPNNKERFDSNGFDNLKYNWNGKNYAYQIKNNKYNNLKEFHNIKPYELLEQDIQKYNNLYNKIIDE